MASKTKAGSVRDSGAPVEHIDEIVLAGVKVQVRAVDLPIASVKLDPRNPRLANTVASNGDLKADEQQRYLADLLWSDRDVKQLYTSVRENKGLVERIIVRANGVVAEGNCRTVVYRKLHDSFKNDPLWLKIPARVLPADISERQIAILLGELHVGGKNEWIPFEKAGHIHELSYTHGLTQDEIAKLLHTSKTAINHHIHAFGAMKDRYLPKYPGPGATRKFSYFLELYKKPALREWVKNNPSALDHFVEWVGSEKIGKGASVRDLDAVIQNPAAIKAFDEGGMEAARPILLRDRPELSSPLLQLMLDMTQAIDDARLDDISRVRADKSGGARAIVQNLKDSLDKFLDLCGGFK